MLLKVLVHDAIHLSHDCACRPVLLTSNSIPGMVPYAIVQQNPMKEQDMSFNINKLSEEIPFEFSPAYNMIWSSNLYVRKQPRKLKEIDWDSLCYDFTLEKSIIQS